MDEWKKKKKDSHPDGEELWAEFRMMALKIEMFNEVKGKPEKEHWLDGTGGGTPS